MEIYGDRSGMTNETTTLFQAYILNLDACSTWAYLTQALFSVPLLALPAISFPAKR